MTPYDVEAVHIMCDLETTGLDPNNNSITSAAFVQFNLLESKYSTLFHVRLWSDTDHTGRVANAETLAWRAQHNVDDMERNLPLFDVPGFLAHVAALFRPPEDIRNMYLWANGIMFDVAFLTSYWEQHVEDVDTPWYYGNLIDYKSFIRGAGYEPRVVSDMVKFEGERHNALDDARHQIRCVHWALADRFGDSSNGTDPHNI
jgi:exodeoxyribonuclease VIII